MAVERPFRCYRRTHSFCPGGRSAGTRWGAGASPLLSCQGRGIEHMSTTIQQDIETRLAEAEPDVEVLLAEVVGGAHGAPLHRPPRGRVARALRARHAPPRRGPRAVRARGLVARARAPPDQAAALPPVPRPARARAHARGARRPPDASPASSSAPPTTTVTIAADTGVIADPVRRHHAIEPRGGVAHVTRDPGGHDARWRARRASPPTSCATPSRTPCSPPTRSSPARRSTPASSSTPRPRTTASSS